MATKKGSKKPRPASAEVATTPTIVEQVVDRITAPEEAAVASASNPLAAANAAWQQGLEAISHRMLGLTHESMERLAATGLALLDSRSLPGAMGVGLDFARGHWDQVLRGSAELSELGWKTASAVYQPVITGAQATVVALARAPLDRS